MGAAADSSSTNCLSKREVYLRGSLKCLALAILHLLRTVLCRRAARELIMSTVHACLQHDSALWPQLPTALPPRKVLTLHPGAEAALPLRQDTDASRLPSADSGQPFETSAPFLIADGGV